MIDMVQGDRVARPSRPVDRRRLPANLLMSALLIGFGLAWVAPAGAQSSMTVGNNSGVIVNTDVLNSLGAGSATPAFNLQTNAPTSSYTPPNTNGLLLTRPATLLFPPPSAPVSRLAEDSRLSAGAAPRLLPPQATTIIGGDSATAVASNTPESRLLIPLSPSRSADTAAAAPVPAAPSAKAPTLTAPAPPPAPAPTVAVVQSKPKPLQSTPVPVQPQVVQPQIAAESDPDDTPIPQVETTEAPPPIPQPAPQPAPAPEPEPATAAVEPAIPQPSASENEAQESAELPQPPPVPTPVPAPAPEPAAPQVAAEPQAESAPQTAALPPAAAEDSGVMLSILFAEESGELTDEGQAQLKALADRLLSDESLRVQLLAYASSGSNSANVARRLSLSRALKVRGFLKDQGIPAERMQVRALGDRTEDGPQDRVDIKPQGG